MTGYYECTLSAERLRACYELAPPKTRAYLEGEIAHALEQIPPSARVLELGCGYGRILRRLSAKAKEAVGIDTSLDSLRMAQGLLPTWPGLHLLAMNAVRLGFADRSFDVTLCLQNGISAFSVDPETLLREAIRVTRPGGTVLFSSYTERFWNDRLEWFQAQADHGLIGAMDRSATGNGVIVCKDGFRATTMTAAGFLDLARRLRLEPRIVEVGESSLFCELTP